MNKVQEMFRKVRLTSLEKLVLAGGSAYVLFIILLREVITLQTNAFVVISLAIVSVVSTCMLILGVCMVLYRFLAYLYAHLSESSFVKNLVEWFSTDDR